MVVGILRNLMQSAVLYRYIIQNEFTDRKAVKTQRYAGLLSLTFSYAHPTATRILAVLAEDLESKEELGH